MSSFKKLNTKIYQKPNSVVTSDFIYWKKLSPPVLVKEFGPIDYIDFSPVEPYFFSVTCSVRVQVYNPITKLVVKNLSRFRENAYGASFRSDGRLLCAGGEETNVKLFDLSTKSLLRLFKGHSAPVHRTFFIKDQPQIASFSDDKSVKVWDISTEKCLVTFDGHNDYVRAGATNPVVPDTLISGGYDNKINMYDIRTSETIMNVDHGSPIESLLFLPSGSIFLSAGGTDIKIWDTIAGGRLLGSISQHHKTITCLRLASDNKRLLSSSLDTHVKIYDISNYKVVHTLDYPNPVLSLGVSKNDDTVVAGLVDGLVSISRREDRQDIKSSKEMVKRKVSFQHKINIHHPMVDTIVPQYAKESESKYDKCLRKFEYAKALNSVLLPYVVNKNPQITVSVMQELIKRRALGRAFASRDANSLLQIIRFFIRNITTKRFTKVLINAANIFLDTYEDNEIILNSEINAALLNLVRLLRDEEILENELIQLEGAMHMLLSAATITEQSRPEPTHTLTPSKDAQKNLIVELS